MRVRILATGGTIASTATHDGDVVATLGPEALVSAVPDLAGIAHIEVEQVANVNGWNVTPEVLRILIDRVAHATAEGADGIVITHGTDTIEETSLLVDLASDDTTPPVVFTCAMRAADEVGADGPRNLLDAVRVAADPASRGRRTSLCANGEIHAARWVTKVHTRSQAAFASPSRGPVGLVSEAGVSYRGPGPGSRVAGFGGIDPGVALVKTWPGMSGEVIEWYTSRGTSGIVLEGTGLGNIPESILAAIESAIAAGVIVVVSSRCAHGGTGAVYGGPGGGRALQRMGVIQARDLNGPKARVALMAALRSTSELDAKRWFMSV